MKSFKTKNVIVRKFEMDDVEQAYYNLSIYNDMENICDETIPKNMNKTKIIIKSAIREYYTDEPIWAVEDKETKHLIGYIRVTNYSPKNKMCNITWAMSYKYWDNCFMKDALTQILNFLFTKKNIELVECSYYEQNSEYSVILESIGMTKEACLRDRRINERTNKKENFVIYSINKEEFFRTIRNKYIKFLHKKIS